MKRPLPIKCMWDGEALVLRPMGRSVSHCTEQFGGGEIVTLERHEERSEASHGHFFAAVTEAWQNLPHGLDDEFPSANHLRKFALIKANYCTMQKIVCETQA